MLKNTFDLVDTMHSMFRKVSDTNVSYTTFDLALDCLEIGKLADGDVVAWYPRKLGTVLAFHLDTLQDYLNTFNVSSVGGLVICKNSDGYNVYHVVDNTDIMSVFSAKKA